jgi:adenosylmethionine-8-amino-7-oxononanoate aminotransferase
MTHVFPRHTKASLTSAARGDGCYLIDKAGKRYLDASGGAAVSCLGHSDSKVREAIRTQLEKLAYAHTSFFTTDAAEALASKLIAHAPEDIDRVYFVSGGSEAVEAALKLARQYFVEIGEPRRQHIVSRWQSYHGNTLGALSAGGNRWRRQIFEPLLLQIRHISPCYAYRWRAAGESDGDYGQRVANELEAEILRLGPETVAAFIAEPVVGATLGAVPAVTGYFTRIRDICDRYGVLLILDEVMCGMGRTGTLFACEQESIRPDIITIAKGLGAGYQPIGAMLCSATIYSAIERGSGFFQHGHTYLAHATCCAGSLAVLQRLVDDGLVGRSAEMGRLLALELSERFKDHPNIGDIRGRGLFRGLELVADRATKAPFEPERTIHTKVKRAAMDEGLLCYPMAGTVDGKRGDHILLAPPFIITEEQIGELVSKLDSAVMRSLA